MALFIFKCTDCNIEIKKLFKTESAIKQFNCPKCNNFEHIIRSSNAKVSTLTYEVIDNGIQIKRVEQLAGAPDMLNEREEINKRKKQDNNLG